VRRRDARLGRELAIGLGGYAAYLAVRRIVWTDRGRDRARHNAERTLAAERWAGVAVEADVQRVALRLPRLIDALNLGYAAGNVGLTVGWLIALYRRADPDFARERRAAVAAFLGALPVFAAVPMSPPRALDGFVDTLAARGVSPETPLLTRFYNPISAMPSLHLAFAVVSGVGLAGRAGRARSRWRRRAWLAYPAAVAAVVVATGNHFVADVGAGAVLGAAARAVTR
jgi:hypothetical protein